MYDDLFAFGIFAMALFWSWSLWDGLRSGQIAIKAQSADRELQPILYWFAVAVHVYLIGLTLILSFEFAVR